MAAWRQAVKNSDAYKTLLAKHGEYRDYLLRTKELWARSYAQYVAQRSGNVRLRAQIQDVRAGQTNFWRESQWAEADFAPIASAIDQLFSSLGWI